MGLTTISRDQRICALCKYWNGAIGSKTIRIVPGGNAFSFETNETHACFKKGRGMQTKAIQQCQYFMARYEV